MVSSLEIVSAEVQRTIMSEMERIGLLFRFFSRAKSQDSIFAKIAKKKYVEKGKKLQDAIGFRIVVYFTDDIELVITILKKLFAVNNEEIDTPNEDTFRPKRTNIVFDLPSDSTGPFKSAFAEEHRSLIDQTFEVQVRSVLSEGWHEVEHDLRYKCQEDWVKNADLSRALNGIYASLENSDWSMLKIFQDLSHRAYKSKEWSIMLRNKLRLRIKNQALSSQLEEYLQMNNSVAKKIYRTERSEFMKCLLKSRLSIPLTFDNCIFVINYAFIGDSALHSLASPFIRQEIEDFITSVESLN